MQLESKHMKSSKSTRICLEIVLKNVNTEPGLVLICKAVFKNLLIPDKHTFSKPSNSDLKTTARVGDRGKGEIKRHWGKHFSFTYTSD